jgi:hypothetical protein
MRFPSLLCFILVLMVSNSFAAEAPQRKPGKWRMEIETDGKKVKGLPPLELCYGTDNLAVNGDRKNFLTNIKAVCKTNEIKKVGNDYVLEEDCTMSKVHAITKTVYSGDFNSAYTSTTTSTVTAKDKPAKETKVVMKNTFMGDCIPAKK